MKLRHAVRILANIVFVLGFGACLLVTTPAFAIGLSKDAASTDQNGSIAGVVTDSAATLVAGVHVAAYQYNAALDGWFAQAWTDTDATGHYLIPALQAGVYRVEFVDATFLRYRTEYYDNALTLESAQDITVGADAIVTNINAQLILLGHITGVVTDAQGHPVRDIQVTAYRDLPGIGWYDYSFAVTDATGHYDLRAIEPGAYPVRFIDGAGRYSTEWFNNQADLEHAERIAVSESEVVAGVDAQLQASYDFLFMSSDHGGKVGDIRFRDEDILAYHLHTGAWSLLFDGSDVGIHVDLDDFELLADGSLLLTFEKDFHLPGFGRVDDADIVQFVPTTLSAKTQGHFAWFLDGSDVGLTTDGEDIDAVGFAADGRLLISTRGPFQVAGLVGEDEDLLALNNASFGEATSGEWALYFDGGNVGLTDPDEDVRSLWTDGSSQALYLSAKDDFAVDLGVSGDGNDVFVCMPLPPESSLGCIFTSFWEGDWYGMQHNIDGLALGRLPLLFTADLQSNDKTGGEADETELDDEEHDPDAEEGESRQRLFLPVVVR